MNKIIGFMIGAMVLGGCQAHIAGTEGRLPGRALEVSKPAYNPDGQHETLPYYSKSKVYSGNIARAESHLKRTQDEASRNELNVYIKDMRHKLNSLTTRGRVEATDNSRAFHAGEKILRAHKEHAEQVKAGNTWEAIQVLERNMGDVIEATMDLTDRYGHKETDEILETIKTTLSNPVEHTNFKYIEEHVKPAVSEVTYGKSKRLVSLNMFVPVYEEGAQSVTAIADFTMVKTKVKVASGEETRTIRERIKPKFDYIGMRYNYKF